MDEESREEVMKALNKAIEIFHKELGWDIGPLLKIEARVLRSGDWSLGESIIVDEIKEYLERNKNEHRD